MGIIGVIAMFVIQAVVQHQFDELISKLDEKFATKDQLRLVEQQVIANHNMCKERHGID
jgi:hypothetical protein